MRNLKTITLKKPTLKAIHICNSLQPTHKPKIAKEYVFAHAENQVERKKPAYNNAHKKLLNSNKYDI